MNNLKIIFRHLCRNKLFTLLNILGLSIGISASWIVFRIVYHEFSFDRQHPQKEKIYKLYSNFNENGTDRKFDGTPYPLSFYLKENLPSLEVLAPVFNWGAEIIKVTNTKGEVLKFEDQPHIIATTSDYFKLVPYNWLAGAPQTAFKGRDEIVLTLSRAKQYFPEQAPKNIVGRILDYGDKLYTVTGVVSDLDYPSTFDAKEFIQLTADPDQMSIWKNTNFNYKIFYKLGASGSPKQVEEVATKKVTQMIGEEFKKYNLIPGYTSTVLSDVHFDPILQNHADKGRLYGMIAIAAFLLILACINYINLTTAQVPYRAKEIGIRKTIGEQPSHITATFIQETLFICLGALLCSWPLTRLFKRYFGSYLPDQLDAYSDKDILLAFFFILLIVITFFSSLYPSYLISKIRAAEVLKWKGIGKLSGSSLSLRKFLIVFQFVIAQVFVILSVIMGNQLKYMLTTDVGFKDQGIITFRLPHKKAQTSNADPFLFKQILEKYPTVSAASLGHLPMNDDQWGNNITMQTDTGEILVNMPFKYVDNNYVDVFGLNILAGRALTTADTSLSVILNQVAIDKFGFKRPVDAVGQIVSINEKPTTIVGVVSNFHNFNLHATLDAIALQSSVDQNMLQYLSVKLTPDTKQWSSTLDQIEKEWKKLYPNAPFVYTFYDQRIKELYEADYRFFSMINLSTSITILLSCLGLIGLVTITTAQRAKEIGIRKVLGSTVMGIVGLLSKDYFKLILLSIAIATPIAWYAINKWLQDFAFKITMSWWMFALPALITLLFAFLAISYQSIKAAKTNPVDSLRDE